MPLVSSQRHWYIYLPSPIRSAIDPFIKRHPEVGIPPGLKAVWQIQRRHLIALGCARLRTGMRPAASNRRYDHGLPVKYMRMVPGACSSFPPQ